MPKILRIINRFNLGGPTYNAAYLAKFMEDEYETLLIGGEIDESEDSSQFILDHLNLKPIIIPEMKREIDFKNDRIAYKKIKEIIREFKPDIVHTHASKAGALGRMAAKKLNVPVIVHTFHGHVFHSYFGKAKTLFYKTAEKKLAKYSTKIIAISDKQKKEIATVHNICPSEKVEVIPLGFDLEKFRQNQPEKRISFRNEWNLQNEEIAIGIIGRLVPIKDHHFFLEVANQVIQKTSKKIRFLIIGDGESRNELENYCTSLNLSYSFEKDKTEIITFTSWIKEIDIALAGLDIVCLTSKNEGTPVSLIEAQAAMKPIVSTNVGGIENIVQINETALLSDPYDKNTFVENLLDLIENDEKRARFSANGGEVYHSFNYLRLVDDMKKLYQSLLSK